MHKILIVSPHLDDAVFSCAARILRETEAGADVTVATVFSHARRRSKQWPEYVTRREEDRQSLRVLNAKPRWLGLLDAPCRNPFYNSFRRIILETAPADRDYVAVVRERLSRLLDELTPDVVYLPLAVGMHIDHRLAFAAATSLPTTCPCEFYEDQPYALVRSAVEMRLQEIRAAPVVGGKDHVVSRQATAARIARFIRSFRAAPYVRRYLPVGAKRNEVETLMCDKLIAMTKPELWLECEIERNSDSDQSRVVRAVYAYRSQARHFLGPRKQFIAACKRHASDLGLTSWRAERYWKPVSTRVVATC